MSYTSQAELMERYDSSMLIDLTDRGDPPAGAIDADVVARALADTDALIDGYLKGRYRLPIATTPPLLRDLALEIAIYKLHRNQASDKITGDYKDALRALAQIAAGVIRLDVAGAEPAASGTSGVRASDRCRDMTPDNLKGFI